MDALVLWLLAALIAFGAMAYFFIKMRKDEKKDEKKLEEKNEPELDTAAVKPLLKPILNPVLKEPDLLMDPLDPLLEEFPQTRLRTAPMLQKAPELIAITVMARRKVMSATVAPKGFKGSALFAALIGARMRFIEPGIFERFHSEDDSLFKVVSVTEPGVFDKNSMNVAYYAGLLFFMTLPGPKDPVFAFDTMLSTAKQLARILGGELCDVDRHLLSKEHIDLLRKNIYQQQASA